MYNTTDIWLALWVGCSAGIVIGAFITAIFASKNPNE